MFITNVLLKRAKAKVILVQMKSAVSGHTFLRLRDRLADKCEVIWFDPWINQESLYREAKKVKSFKK